jgi:phage/plasmid-associated DNA primase
MAFIGKHNSTAASLHKLELDKFAGARLVGKLANICPDLPTSHLASTSIFKALTGGDVVTTEYKHKDSFEFTPFCKLLFSANKPPQSDDSTHGLFRRWQVIPKRWIGGKEGYEVDDYEIDTGAIEALNSIEKRAAVETGQEIDRQDINVRGDLQAQADVLRKAFTLDELEAMDAKIEAAKAPARRSLSKRPRRSLTLR